MKFLIFFHDNLCGIDEYIVEHIHSIIHRNTSSSDSIDQLPKKVSDIFASRERQANFRASFTPPKIYVFSRSEIQTIYAKVASVTVSIVKAIATNQNVAHPLPRVPRQRQNCTMWQMPALFGAGKEMKSYFLPLGFQFCPSPDPMSAVKYVMCL